MEGALYDVLIENFKQSGLDQDFNLEPEALAARYHLIRVRLVGFEYAPERLTCNVVVQAEAGFMGMNGFDDRPPVRMPVALMDVYGISSSPHGRYGRSSGSRSR